MPQAGIHSVTVPGAVEGWERLHKKYGRLAWADLFQPAIYYARNGFPVTEWIQGSWDGARSKLLADDNARRIYLRDAQPPKVGEVWKLPEMARAFELIAAQGAATVYKGAIAQSILKTSRRLGGSMSAADLADYQSEWVEPISTKYRGWDVYELPPNSQGMAALSMLNIMERFDIGKWEPLSTDALHYKIEAQKLAYADLQRYLGDPRSSGIPIRELISKPYAEKRAQLVDAERARCNVDPGQPIPGTGDTIYLSTVDKEGTVVSLIQSVYLSFGSGVVVDDFGFHLHNRGGLFTLGRRPPQRAPAPQAPLPHHHSRLHGEGWIARRLRHYGRPQSGASPCPIRLLRRRSWRQYTDGARAPPLHQAQLLRLRRDAGGARARQDRREPSRARPPRPDARRFFIVDGRWASRAPRLQNEGELRRVLSSKGRRRRARGLIRISARQP
jgi:gamma-glutamyltranspeptidase